MRRVVLLSILVQVIAVAAFSFGLIARAVPLGVRGEWEWLTLPPGVGPNGAEIATGCIAVAVYAAFAAWGFRLLSVRASKRLEWLLAGVLLPVSVLTQILVLCAAPQGYGLSKWALALYQSGSSGYYTVARREIRDPWRFLADYSHWIEGQDSLHIGTHPPGLFLVASAMLETMRNHPALARTVDDHLPASVGAGFRVIGQFDPLPRADRAALALTGALTLLACASTVVPLYVLARAGLAAPAAWAAAALWPLVPSAILFQPAADTALPFLSVSAMALAAHAGRASLRTGLILAFGSGLVLAIGMAFTLAFLPVGLIVALLLATSTAVAWRNRLFFVLATGAGFLGLTFTAWALTRANPFVIWWWNQRNHARFYVEYPRSYLKWVLANPLELAAALGLPATCWAVLGAWPVWESPRVAFRSAKGRLIRVLGTVPIPESPRVASLTLCVLLLLTLSGKNLSEVARLWVPLMPALLVAAGHGLARLGGTPRTLGLSVLLTGIETLVLESTIQVVYPV